MEAIIFLITFLLGSIVAFIIRAARRPSESRSLPPSLPSLPLIGSLPFISPFDTLAKFFVKKSKQLGPIFTFKMGGKRFLVLNDREVITEALLKNNLTFAGRGPFSLEIYGDNPNGKGIIFRNFDERFKRYHQLSLSIMKEFGFGNKQLMESRIIVEVETLIAFFKTKRSEAFNPREIMSQANLNIVLSILFGIRHDYEGGLTKLASEVEKLGNSSDPIFNVVPFLRFFPYFKTKFDEWSEANKIMMEIIERQIEEIKKNVGTESFVNSYLNKAGVDYDHEQLMFTCRDFIIAGTDTTATSLRWSFVLVGNHPEVQKRLQDEIDSVVPRDRLPNRLDEASLPYTQATILEIMRFKTIVPLAVPHITLKDSKVKSYDIPSGTTVMPNLYAVHMDSKEWGDPENFRPERFLDNSGAIIKKEKVIPFSLGRRSCLGEVLARQEFFLFLTGLFQNFIVLPPASQLLIDDKEHSGTVVQPKPFKIRMIPRD